jgi:PAS domain S-box-containing protein
LDETLRTGTVAGGMDEARTAAELARSPEVKAYLAYPGWAAFVGRGEGTVLWASPNCAEVLGHRPEDMVGRNAWMLLIDPADIHQAASLRALMSEGDTRIWAHYKDAKGAKAWYRVEILARKGLYVAVLRREPDPSMHTWHGNLRRA